MPMNVLRHQGRREFWLKNNLTGLLIHQVSPLIGNAVLIVRWGSFTVLKGCVDDDKDDPRPFDNTDDHQRPQMTAFRKNSTIYNTLGFPPGNSELRKPLG